MPSLQLISRQTGITECVATCGDLGGCSSILDYACICQSAAYQASVATCWTGCDAEEVALGQAFSQERCSAVGVTLPTAFSSGISASATASASVSAIASITSIAITGTPASWLEPPKLYERTLLNVQAIMSSICAALFIVAVVFGVLSCRARIKRERGQTSSQWSAAGTFGDRTKFDPTSSRYPATSTNPGTIKFPNSQSQTDTFMSSLEEYRNTVSLPSKPSAAAGAGGPRFTNRMSVPVPEEEEWELSELKTPTSASTMGEQQDNKDGMGSREALNQVEVLDKYGRGV